MNRFLNRVAIACAIVAIASWLFLLDTGLAMYKDGCYWELMTWPHWRIPYALQSAIRYTALATPLLATVAIGGVGITRFRGRRPDRSGGAFLSNWW